jgi:hypothetical protein
LRDLYWALASPARGHQLSPPLKKRAFAAFDRASFYYWENFEQCEKLLKPSLQPECAGPSPWHAFYACPRAGGQAPPFPSAPDGSWVESPGCPDSRPRSGFHLPRATLMRGRPKRTPRARAVSRACQARPDLSSHRIPSRHKPWRIRRPSTAHPEMPASARPSKPWRNRKPQHNVFQNTGPVF